MAVSLYHFTATDPKISLGIIATGISISFGIRQYRIENDRIFKELFTEFNKRFDVLNNDLEKIKSGIEPINEHALQDYINLCAEEFLWYKKGRIDKEVWYTWLKGMSDNLKDDKIRTAFRQESRFKGSYYGLFECLTNQNIEF